MVSKEGLPIAYEVFSGNTFEGKTFIPMIQSFIQKNKVETLTVVADAAMISTENSTALSEKGINFIVGARLGNVSSDLLSEIDSKIVREDGRSIRIKTLHGDLICAYSSLRYRKDKYEMEKQIEKAKFFIDNPGKNKKLKFTKSSGIKMELTKTLSTKPINYLGSKDITQISQNQLLIIKPSCSNTENYIGLNRHLGYQKVIYKPDLYSILKKNLLSFIY
jgi:transposase